MVVGIVILLVALCVLQYVYRAKILNTVTNTAHEKAINGTPHTGYRYVQQPVCPRVTGKKNANTVQRLALALVYRPAGEVTNIPNMLRDARTLQNTIGEGTVFF